MPYGDHWEWRGFGQVDEDFRAWFQTLPFFYAPSDKPLRDDYLWTPGCLHNVKLRYDALKFKRFIERRGEYEHWREDESEFLPFPLDAERLHELERLLSVRLSDMPTTPVDRALFLTLITRADPPVRVITVLKQRRLARWRLGDDALVLEMTRILHPRTTETVALEHASLTVLQKAHARLASHFTRMHPMNYLQALSLWMKDPLE